MNEFSELDRMASEVWWRTPIAVFLISGFFWMLFDAQANDFSTPQNVSGEFSSKKSPKFVARIDSILARVSALSFLRCAAALFACRFAWIYCTNLSGLFYPVGKLESLAWLAWLLFGLPMWSFEEKEKWLNYERPN